MIGTPNGYISTLHSTYASDENSVSETNDDLKHRRSMSNSPIDDKKYSLAFESAISSRREIKDYNWPSHNPINYSTYDDNDNITNAPLNLSVNGNEPDVIKHATPQLLSLPNSTSIAQLVLTSGQMVQGIQGAQLFVPTSQGLAKQIVLTIPITHVTTDQVINLSLADGQIMPTTVGELLKLAMPKNIFKDDLPGEKIINELMKLSEQTSVYIAEYLKSALKCSKKHHDDSKHRSESGNESSEEKEVNSEDSLVDEKPDIKSTDIAFNGIFKKPVRDMCTESEKAKNTFTPRKPVITNSYENNVDLNLPKHKTQKQNHDTGSYNDHCYKKLSSQRLSNDYPMHLLPSELIDKKLISANTREEPSSTNNYETENSYKYNNAFRQEGSSPSDSYDENDLDDIKEFAKSFKLRRLSMGLTQTQVGQALNIAEGPTYSQSAICSALASHVYAAQIASQQHSIFEKLDITPKSAQKIKPVLERWMKEAEERYRNGQGLLTEFIGMESSKKRKRRTSFTPQALQMLNTHFEHNTHPSGTEITALAHQLGYDREVIRIWFCNKRQALKNTVRMMSKHMM